MSGPGFDLTDRERELMVYLSARDTCPTYEQAANAIGIRGKSQIHRLMSQLEQKGYIRRRPHATRSLVVLRPLRPGPAEQHLEPTGVASLALHGPVPSAPKAAGWDYPFRDHRTVAEVWADEDRRAA